jgi:Flp pilus assembly pilin Flp
MLSAYVHVRIALLVLVDSLRQREERGQTSAEYALVLLGAAAIALLIVAWATKTDLIGKLFDAVVNAITGKVDD